MWDHQLEYKQLWGMDHIAFLLHVSHPRTAFDLDSVPNKLHKVWGDGHRKMRVEMKLASTNSQRISLCLYHPNIRSPRTAALPSQNLARYLECPRYLRHVFQLNKWWVDGPGLTQKPSVSLLVHRPPLGYGTVTTTMANEGNSWRW